MLRFALSLLPTAVALQGSGGSPPAASWVRLEPAFAANEGQHANGREFLTRASGIGVATEGASLVLDLPSKKVAEGRVVRLTFATSSPAPVTTP